MNGWAVTTWFVAAFCSLAIASRSRPSFGYGESGRGPLPYGSRSTLRLRELESRLDRLEQQGCESGTVEAFICDENAVVPLCNIFTLFTGSYISADIPVTFERRFTDTPVVHAGLSGIFDLGAKNCTIESTDVTDKGFNIQLTLGGLLPFELRFSWIACTGAAFLQQD